MNHNRQKNDYKHHGQIEKPETTNDAISDALALVHSAKVA
jgi:hypothetical protein